MSTNTDKFLRKVTGRGWIRSKDCGHTGAQVRRREVITSDRTNEVSGNDVVAQLK